MIKSSSLTCLLQKAISNGIETVFISKLSGEILCIEGKESNQTFSDIISTMWNEYYQIGKSSLKDEKLNYLLIENEDSYIITTNIYSYIICIKSNKNMKLGMLKKHLEGLTQNLNKMLEPFKDIIIKKEEESNEDN